MIISNLISISMLWKKLKKKSKLQNGMHCRRIILFMRCKQNIYLHKIFCHILFIFLLPDTNHQLWCKKFQIMFLLFSVIRELYNEHERPKLTLTLNFFVPRHHLIFSNFLYDPFSRSLSPPHWFSIQWRPDDFKKPKVKSWMSSPPQAILLWKGFDKKICDGAFYQHHRWAKTHCIFMLEVCRMKFKFHAVARVSNLIKRH